MIVLIVFVTNLAGVDSAVLRAAQTEARELLAPVGIDVQFEEDLHRGVHADARLVLVPREDGALRTGFISVLGAAKRRPNATGGTAWVFYDRVAHRADHYAVPLNKLLACAIAHELGHLLLASPSHEPHGLMRANWSEVEYRKAALGRLRFSAGEAGSIR